MGLGSTAKKLQQLADVAEKLYAKVNEVLDRLSDLRDRVEETSDRLEAMEGELSEQRAIVEALAEAEGIDVESAVATVETGRRTPGGSGDEDETGITGDDEDATDPGDDGGESPATGPGGATAE